MVLKLSPQIQEFLQKNFEEHEKLQVLWLLVQVRLVRDNPEIRISEGGFLPDNVKMDKDIAMKMIKTNLFEVTGENKFKLVFPLFEEALSSSQPETSDAWIAEYRNMFKPVNEDRWGTLSSCKSRMQDFMKKNPDVTKDEVLGATQLYLRNTDPKYVMKSHKFIYDGIGAMKNSSLEQWIESFRKQKTLQTNQKTTTDKTERMQ